MDFADLQNDEQIKNKVTNLHNSVQKIRNLLDLAYKENISNKLTTSEKIDYDLFLSYSLDTLYWMYLRTKGIDPNDHEIKDQLSRVKTYMIRAKQVIKNITSIIVLKYIFFIGFQAKDRHTIRPKLNVAASKRFIQHGLWTDDRDKEPPNKRIKFD